MSVKLRPIPAFKCYSSRSLRAFERQGQVRHLFEAFKSQMLEPSLWIIKFTIDPSSFDRLSLAPKNSESCFRLGAARLGMAQI